MVKPKYLITNVVYGETYSRLFLTNHLKSILDPSNLPKLAETYDIEYTLLTDKDTLQKMSYHPNFKRLSEICKITTFGLIEWPKEKINKFAYRYSLILDLVKGSIQKAIDDDAVLTCWVADLVVAKDFFPRVMKRIEEGHGAVFVVPLRSAWRPLGLKIDETDGALDDTDLCNMCIEYLHPLWTSSLWQNPMFTKLPFTLLWNTVGGLMARTFQPTPIIFKPKKEMLDSRGMIDGDIPALCENPYWATDWTDAPVVGVEPLECYYPPFANRPATTAWLKEWTANLHHTQKPYLQMRMFYPSQKAVNPPAELLAQSDAVVSEITDGRSW